MPADLAKNVPLFLGNTWQIYLDKGKKGSMLRA
jgi:hypothetical protein